LEPCPIRTMFSVETALTGLVAAGYKHGALPGGTREELTALIEGRLSTASAKGELVKLATRLIVED
jgi:hypothetical protein